MPQHTVNKVISALLALVVDSAGDTFSDESFLSVAGKAFFRSEEDHGNDFEGEGVVEEAAEDGDEVYEGDGVEDPEVVG